MKNLIYHLVYDKPFRNVFYYRIGKKHFLFSWLLPRCSYTKISQKMIVGKDLYIEHGFNTLKKELPIWIEDKKNKKN